MKFISYNLSSIIMMCANGQTASLDLQQRFPRPQVSTDGGLVLYYHPHNFFSQKIVIALYEKRIPFTAHVVNILAGEQYSPWFLQLNPRGEVPVLQDGEHIVPDSARILAYLEQHYVGDNFMPLLPPGKENAVARERIALFHRKICMLSIGNISMLAFVHPDVGAAPKPPMDNVTVASMELTKRRVRQVLTELGEQSHPLADGLIRRMDQQATKSATGQQSHAVFMHVLSIVHELLAEVDSHLDRQPTTLWLYSDQFSVADLDLGMLLHRLSLLGLDELCWLQPHRSRIAEYFERVVRRESFRRTIESGSNAAERNAADEGDGNALWWQLMDGVAAGLGVSVDVWANISTNHVAAAVTVLSAAIVLLVPLYASTSGK